MGARERIYERLCAERGQLESLIATLPEDSLSRLSLEYRLESVQEELAANPPPDRWPANAKLVFIGDPVVDMGGIEIGFASKAMEAFQKAVTSLAASQHGPLPLRGKIPSRSDHRLLVTEVVGGSFGFGIEEDLENAPAQATMHGPLGQSPLETAFEQTMNLMESLAKDKDVVALIGNTDQRALRELRTFLEVLDEGEAYCGLMVPDGEFRFENVDQVQECLTRIEETVVEQESVVRGHFQGYLPEKRNAEFFDVDRDEVLFCRIDAELHGAEEINEILGTPVEVRLFSRRVGSGSARHTILGYTLIGTEAYLDDATSREDSQAP